MPARRRVLVVGALLALPIAILLLLLARPSLDATWENQPAHFWLVLLAALASVGLGVAVFRAARQRGDARLLLVSLAFVVAAGFLGLHALATPGVLLEGSTPGFLLANPIGLAVAGVFAALSPWRWSRQTSLRLIAWSGALLGLLLGVLLVWAVFSVFELPPLDRALTLEDAESTLWAIAMVGLPLYAIAAYGYVRLYRERGTKLVFGITVAFVLLAEAMLVVAVAENWRLSWWEWHVLMVIAFAAISYAAWKEWPEERFAHLYLDETLSASEEVTLMFADLQGYTSFTERVGPDEAAKMLNAYWAELLPVLEQHHADVQDLIGDEVMAIFRGEGHASRAGLAALRFQAEAARIARDGWPRFRAGLNTGVVTAGIVGASSGLRKHGVVGDTVNTAARLQSAAPVGCVLVGEETRQHLPPDAVVEERAPLDLKGKEELVQAYVLRSVPEPEAQRRRTRSGLFRTPG